ncbi:MAG TPA: response regulator [Anaerolineae bacterium]
MTPIAILIVDDEPVTREMLAMILQIEQPAWTVYGVECGQDALDIVAEHDIHLALLDIAMPEMDGIELCRRLREMPRLAQVPIVMFTGFDNPERRIRAREAGANDYWLKPFLPSQLVPKMEQLIEAAQAMK